MSDTSKLPARLGASGRLATPRRVSFAFTLAGTMGVLVLLAVATVIAIQMTTARSNTLDLVNLISSMVLESIEAGIDDHLQPAAAQMEYLAERIESGDYGLADSERLGTLLDGALSATPQVAGIAVWDPDFRQLIVRRMPGAEPRIEVNDRSRDAELLAATAQLRETEGTFWGEPVRAADGIGLINLRRALRRSGRIIGYMAAVITVPEFSQLVTEIGDQFDSTAFILYGKDRVLAHPNLANTVPSEGDGKPGAPLGHVGDLVVENLWEGTPLRGFEAAAQDQVNVVEIGLGDQSYAAVYAWIYGYGKVPWAIGVWTLKEDVIAELTRLRFAGGAGIVVLILAIVLAVFLGRMIARPLKRVASSAALVGELDLSHVERLPASVILELDDQSRAFNTMLASLRSFETYVPRSLVTRLMRKGGDETEASLERELTVLFTDIADFTSMAEGMPAAAVAGFLNEHFALLGACVEAGGGTVDKFIGDALMAFWGAPEEQPDHAARAVRAARAMAAAIEADNRARSARGLPPVRLRIGIHSGPVVVGNVGWPGRINYTIVGDTVNACQRIESLGKELGGEEAVTILLSEATVRLLDDDPTPVAAGSFKVKGKSEDIKVFRLPA